VIAWPLVLAHDLRKCTPIEWRADQYDPPFAPRRRELSERLSIAQAEARARVHDPLDAVADVPFGFLHARCLEFLAQRQPDDVLWRFESRRRVGQGEVWREGYAWVGRRGILAAWASASETDGSG